MAADSPRTRSPEVLVTSDFRIDLRTGELHRNGFLIHLQNQPFQVLACLAQRSGDVVSREELRQLLWREDTFVDFNNGLNAAINKVREALGDSAEQPRFIETLPRRGYRFIAKVVSASDSVDAVVEPVNGEAVRLAQPRVAGHSPAGRSRRWAVVAVVFFLALLGTGALYWILRPRTPVVTAIHQLTHTGHHKTLGGDATAVFRHPQTDGTRIYFDEIGEGKWRLAQVSTKGGEVSFLDTPSINLPKIAGISSDGSELLVAELTASPNDSPFWVLPLPDGPTHRIPGAFGWVWRLPGTNQIVYQQPSNLKQLYIAKPDGSESRYLMSLPGDLGPYLALSHDGKRTRFATSDGKVWESQLDGIGIHRFLPEFTAPVCCGQWSRNGGLYVFASQQEGVWNLWARSEPTGPLPMFRPQPIQLTNGPISFRLLTPSSDGKQIFAVGETPRGELSVFDPKSELFGKYGSGLSAGFTDFSRDGQWMAYVTHPDGTLWRSRIDGSDRMQLTFPPMGSILNPRWSPDGRFIAFTDFKYSETKVYLVSADGGAPQLLISGDFKPADPTWSPDGKSIAYAGPSLFSGTATEVRILDLETKRSRTIPGSQGLFSSRWSPDGRYIAATSADMSQLFVYSFKSGGWKQLPFPKPVKGTNLGYLSWSHDSRYLYFMNGPNVYRVRIPDGTAELAASTVSIEIICPVFSWGSWFGLTSDDRVLVLRDRSVEKIYSVDLEYR